MLPSGIEQVGLFDAVGRVLAGDIIAPYDLPQSNNSAMDGYAVKATDCQPGKVSFLRVRIEKTADGYQAAISGNQKTSYIKTMVRADGVALLPQERDYFSAGETVMVNLIRTEIEMTEA